MSRKKHGNKVFAALQGLGKTFMLPIALLPVAGLFLGIGASFTSPVFVKMYHLQAILSQGMFLNRLLQVLNDCGNVIFSNLGLFFAVSVALGLAHSEKGVAALSAVVGYFMMYAAMTSAITNFGELSRLQKIGGLLTDMLGFHNTMNTGIFGGILIGLVVVWLHNRYYKIKLPDALSFFGGTHFVPIAASVAGIVCGFLLAWLWPYVGSAIQWTGYAIGKSGIFGAFLYAYIYRALIPFGLHHIFYLPFWQTAVGGTARIAGKTIVGAQNIIFAELGAGQKISWQAAKFFSFEFPEMIGGFPGAALAMYVVAKKSKRAQVKGLLLSSSITSVLTGVTEPLEYTILFASPFLYWGVHCVLFAFSEIFVYLLHVGVGFTFSGGGLDMLLYGILPGQARTNWLPLIPLIVIYFFAYFFIFRWVIVKFDLKTPGREDDDQEASLHTKQEYIDAKAKKHGVSADDVRSAEIVAGLGGKSNIKDLEACATRLRVTVNDPKKVNKGLLKQSGSVGTIINGQGVQSIYGTQVSTIGPEVLDYMKAMTTDMPTILSNTNTKGTKSISKKNTTNQKENVTNSKETDFFTPANGEMEQLADVHDQVFSSGMMGKGYAVKPSDGKIYSPVTGKVIQLFPTKHAIGIKADKYEVLVHMGIDTVQLKGKPFENMIKVGDEVTPTTQISQMNLQEVKDAGKDTTIMVLITNSKDVLASFNLTKEGKVKINDKVGEAMSK